MLDDARNGLLVEREATRHGSHLEARLLRPRCVPTHPLKNIQPRGILFSFEWDLALTIYRHRLPELVEEADGKRLVKVLNPWKRKARLRKAQPSRSTYPINRPLDAIDEDGGGWASDLRSALEVVGDERESLFASCALGRVRTDKTTLAVFYVT